MYSFDKSTAIWKESCKVFTGGEGSQGRTWLFPICLTHGKGSRVWDIDGNEFIDFMLAYGPLIMGHSHPAIVKAVQEQAAKALVNGHLHEGEGVLARKIVALCPHMEQVRFNISGSEADQAAIRLARTYTKKNKILKFMGQYHGWMDNVLVSGAATKEAQMGPYDAPNAVIISKGQPPSVLEDVLVCHFNDLDQVERMLKKHAGEVAAIITEPMMSNAQIIPPQPGFLQGLKDLAHAHGALLIYDEVVSGFRIDLRGGAGYFGVTPDITVFGKALGGGIPISCIGASKEIMSVIHKDGAIHLGTYNSNPLAVAAANATLDYLTAHEAEVYPRMKRLGLRLQNGIREAFAPKGYPIRVQGTESLFAVMFVDQEVRNFADTFKINTDLLKKYKVELYRHGIMVRPELRDIWYLSTEHTDADIDQALTIINDIAKRI